MYIYVGWVNLYWYVGAYVVEIFMYAWTWICMHHNYRIVQIVVWSLSTLSHHQSLSPIAHGKLSRLHPVSAQSWYICLSLSPNTGTSMCRNQLKNITYEFVLTSPAVPSRYRSSYLHCLFDGSQEVVQLLFCRVLLPGFVQNST